MASERLIKWLRLSLLLPREQLRRHHALSISHLHRPVTHSIRHNCGLSTSPTSAGSPRKFRWWLPVRIVAAQTAVSITTARRRQRQSPYVRAAAPTVEPGPWNFDWVAAANLQGGQIQHCPKRHIAIDGNSQRKTPRNSEGHHGTSDIDRLVVVVRVR